MNQNEESQERIKVMAQDLILFMKNDFEARVAQGQDKQSIFMDGITAILIAAISAAVNGGVPLEAIVRMYTMAEQLPSYIQEPTPPKGEQN